MEPSLERLIAAARNLQKIMTAAKATGKPPWEAPLYAAEVNKASGQLVEAALELKGE